MTRPRLLDLYCGAGGAARGYQLAGFHVTGVDNRPQPRYVGEFHQGDALEFAATHGAEFDAIHASPPCHDHTTLVARTGPDGTGDLLPVGRRRRTPGRDRRRLRHRRRAAPRPRHHPPHRRPDVAARQPIRRRPAHEGRPLARPP